MSDMQSSDAQVLRMSFLDVVSCALGGAVLLGLVFSVIRHTPPIQTSSPPFIFVTFDVVEHSREVVPLISVRVDPPNHRAFVLDVRDFDLETGEPRPSTERRHPGDPIDNIFIVGFSPEGKQPLKSGTRPIYAMYLRSPEPGKWTFTPRYTDHYHEPDRPSVPRGYPLRERPIGVRTTAMIRDRRVRLATGTDGVEEIWFGQWAAHGATVNVEPYEN